MSLTKLAIPGGATGTGTGTGTGVGVGAATTGGGSNAAAPAPANGKAGRGRAGAIGEIPVPTSGMGCCGPEGTVQGMSRSENDIVGEGSGSL